MNSDSVSLVVVFLEGQFVALIVFKFRSRRFLDVQIVDGVHSATAVGCKAGSPLHCLLGHLVVWVFINELQESLVGNDSCSKINHEILPRLAELH